ncbi:MAG: rod shape-determining protein MreC [Acidobacteria bacterium]|nr:rod shape-determining protein MreC [Acidobacteriota bacterium]
MILLLLTAVTLLTLSGRGFGPLDSVRSAVGSVLAPVGDAASWATRPFSNAWDSAFSHDDLVAANQRLQEENDRLQGQVTQSAIATEQLQELLALVSIPFVGDTPVAHTRVVAGTAGNFGDTVELDKGSDAGIEVGMPVITGRGLIGRVRLVSASRSTVELVTGGGFKVGFLVIGTSAVGVAQGDGDPSRLRGANIDIAQPVTEGQIVVTAGLRGSSFPPNIPIGSIASVRSDDAARQSTVDIDLYASTRDLTYADVVLWKAAN